MFDIEVKSIFFKNFLFTFQNFSKTAHHHYGKNPYSLVKFVYYSGLKINTFYIYEKKLNLLNTQPIDSDVTVIQPTIDELIRLRKGKDLPREFYYDQIYNMQKCYVALKKDEIAYIAWVLIKGDYSRFLIIPEDAAELNYYTIMPRFRGKYLSAEIMSCIMNDLKAEGFRKVMSVINESNIASIKSIEKAGFKRISTIKSIGPFNNKRKV